MYLLYKNTQKQQQQQRKNNEMKKEYSINTECLYHKKKLFVGTKSAQQIRNKLISVFHFTVFSFKINNANFFSYIPLEHGDVYHFFYAD